MSEARCRRTDDRPNVFPGWICCQCRQYQGYQYRGSCKACGHPPCYEVRPGERLPVVVPAGKGNSYYGETMDGRRWDRGETDPPPSAHVVPASEPG